MAVHTLSETNPTYVTGADSYRVSITALLTPDTPHFTVMQEYFKAEHRRPEGHGLAFLESEEHHLVYTGSVQQIQEYRAGSALDTAQGALYGFWPHGTGWDDFIPHTTWNPGGEGIVTEFTHPLGGKVTVFEYIEETDGQKKPMVGFHCDRCHPSPTIDHEVRMANRGPQDRRWSARNARVHIRSHAERCRPVDPRFAEVAQQVANREYGVNHPTVTWDSRCATTGDCARIRHLRARA
ncbi:hypothetical protein [Streptomyces achromogenes]|uniref:hypothetical protein n=1 Tax=Streptomyces achromogenes TaxID=67255 RepID=UPI00343BCD5B